MRTCPWGLSSAMRVLAERSVVLFHPTSGIIASTCLFLRGDAGKPPRPHWLCRPSEPTSMGTGACRCWPVVPSGMRCSPRNTRSTSPPPRTARTTTLPSTGPYGFGHDAQHHRVRLGAGTVGRIVQAIATLRRIELVKVGLLHEQRRRRCRDLPRALWRRHENRVRGNQCRQSRNPPPPQVETWG